MSAITAAAPSYFRTVFRTSRLSQLAVLAGCLLSTAGIAVVNRQS